MSYNTWGVSWGASWANSWGAGTTPTPTPTPTDTHDPYIPEYARKFYNAERLKHSTVIKAYKKVIEAEPQNEEIKEIVSEFAADTSRITASQLREIAQDKAALTKFLAAIAAVEMRVGKYRQDREDDELLIMLAAAI